LSFRYARRRISFSSIESFGSERNASDDVDFEVVADFAAVDFDAVADFAVAADLDADEGFEVEAAVTAGRLAGA
jgi:hypothetical protein